MSTPGVPPPLLLVTRFTAKALAAKEFTRMRWRLFTLPMRPSFRAFTIRTCSSLTSLSHRCQSIDRQSWGMFEDAHSTSAFRASALFHCRFFIRKFYISFCKELPIGSLPAFAWDDVAIPIRSITPRHSLFPMSSARSPFGFSCDWLTSHY